MSIYCGFEGLKHFYRVYRVHPLTIVFKCEYCEGYKHIPKAGFYYALTGKRFEHFGLRGMRWGAKRIDFIPEPIKSDELVAFPWRLIPTRWRLIWEAHYNAQVAREANRRVRGTDFSELG